MPNGTAPRILSCRLHKTTGLAVVGLNDRDIYLGKHGTPESHANYNRVISEWTSNFRQLHSNGAPLNTAPLATEQEVLGRSTGPDLVVAGLQEPMRWGRAG